MTVAELLKKSLAFSVGVAALSAEKLKQLADEAVQRGEMTSDEARKFVDDVSRKAEDEKKSAQEWIRDQVTRMLQQAGVAEASRVSALEQRVSDLERRLAEQEVPEPPATQPPL